MGIVLNKLERAEDRQGQPSILTQNNTVQINTLNISVDAVREFFSVLKGGPTGNPKETIEELEQIDAPQRPHPDVLWRHLCEKVLDRAALPLIATLPPVSEATSVRVGNLATEKAKVTLRVMIPSRCACSN
jgi:hypothetical protein